MAPDLRHVAGSETVSFTPDLATDRLVFRLWPNAEPYAKWGARLTVGRVAVGGQALPVLRPDPTTLIVGRTLAAGADAHAFYRRLGFESSSNYFRQPLK